MRWALDGGHLTPVPGSHLLYNDPDNNPAKRQYLDPRTCFYVNPQGEKVKHWNRLREDLEVCPDCPKPTPRCSPTPKPPASPRPSPSPGEVPPLDASGNYPMPEVGTCPAHFQNQPFSLHVKVSCKIKDNGGRRCTLDLTQRGEKPYLGHYCFNEDGTPNPGCANVFTGEIWKGCQEPAVVDYIKDFPEDPNPGDGIIMTIFHPKWGYYGACDKITAPPQEGMTNPRENYRCQDSDDLGERTPNTTHYLVCMPSGSPCVEGTY